MSQANLQIKNPKLLGVVKFHVILENLTGLLISTGRQLGRIGGADTSNITIEKKYECPCPGSEGSGQSQTTSITATVPYIPGSSIKGRMRSLLELAKGLELFSTDGKIWMHALSPNVLKSLAKNDRLGYKEFLDKLLRNNDVLIFNKLFGMNSLHVSDLMKELSNEIKDENKAAQDTVSLINSLSPTALLVSDFFPSCDYVCRIYSINGIVTLADFLEEKNENRIDRITSAADPRTIERVKPHVEFEGDLTLLVFNNSKDHLRQYIELISNGLSLIENTYLGASGSRGYGRVKIKKINVSIVYPASEKVGEYGGIDELRKNIDQLKDSLLTKLLPK
ncbi:MAG: type III-A CRISPR-associated RAMP protein Csm3 [Vulcanisaeta sp.]